MKIEKYKNGERISIFPCEYYVTDGPDVISTLLGSCIAACLYDPKRKVIGMNHFMLSNSRYARDLPLNITEAGRYGIHAMDLLINQMMRLGTDRHHLRAKVFGGATMHVPGSPQDNFTCVGEVNCRFITEYLKDERIPIDALDIGGDFGRVIHFSNGDFSVYRRKLDSSRCANVGKRDRDCWRNAIERQQQENTQIDLWR